MMEQYPSKLIRKDSELARVENFRCVLCSKFLNIFPLRLVNKDEKLCGRCPDLYVEGRVSKPVRHVMLEEKLRTKTFPCTMPEDAKNKEGDGCGKTHIAYEEVVDHEIQCPGRLYQCPTVPFGKCPFAGPRASLRSHFRSKHGDFITVDGVFSVGFGENEETVRVFHDGELGDFLISTRTDVEKDKFFICVRYLGDAIANAVHIYSVTFVNPDTFEELTIKNKRVNWNCVLHITKPESTFVNINSTLLNLSQPSGKILLCKVAISKGVECKWKECCVVESINEIRAHERKCSCRDPNEKDPCYLTEMEKVYAPPLTKTSLSTTLMSPDCVRMECRWCSEIFTTEELLGAHEGNCFMMPMPCEFCTSSIPLNEHSDHERTCALNSTTIKEKEPNLKTDETASRMCQGCSTDFSLRTFDKHQAICEHLAFKPCKHCKKQYTENDLPDHEISCNSRMQKCQHCMQSFSGNKQLEDHQFRCDKRPATCTSCSKELPFKELVLHRSVCVNNYKCPTYDEATNADKQEEHRKLEQPSSNEPKMERKCKWCPMSHPHDAIEQHELNCDFRKVTCPHSKCGMEIRYSDQETHLESCNYRDKTKYKCKLCLTKHERPALIKHLKQLHAEDFVEGDTCNRKDLRGTEWQRWYMLYNEDLFRCKCSFWKDGSVSFDAHYEGTSASAKAKKYALRIKVHHPKLTGEPFNRQNPINRSASNYNGCVDIDSPEIAHLIRDNVVHFVFTLVKFN